MQLLKSFRIFAFLVAATALCAAVRANDVPAAASDSGQNAETAAPAESGYYVFTYFTGGGESGVHYAVSRDGYSWTALNDGKAIFAPPLGKRTKLTRDPSVCRGADGVFRLAWTVGWDGRSFAVASSRDLIDWNDAKIVPAMESEPTTRNCWAPEIFFDEKSSQFYILWSSTIPGRFSPAAEGTSEDRYDHRVYVTKTKDFETFSPTELYFDPGHNVIDAYLAEKDGVYYLFYKDETLKPEAKKTILVATAPSPDGPFSPGKTISPENWVEGPSALFVDGAWLVYYDCYTKQKYAAVRSVDGANWESVADKVEFPQGTRHGTAFEVDRETFERLVERFDGDAK